MLTVLKNDEYFLSTKNEYNKLRLDANIKTRKDLTIFDLELIEQDLKEKLMEAQNESNN